MPNIDSARKIPLPPSNLIIADIEKLRKKPRTADNIGIQKTPRIEKPRKTAHTWYLKLSASAESKLGFDEGSLKKNEI
jgi:hypothetical protein